ncbi:hypothetical protein CJ010_15380 [Azoarcus sp. DD4]|uniref:PAS domain S-box protein n=1 Tax=Azoarcus sp. DD4 TaxID=2027405 RepID=UPI00112D7D3F|nr:PAS domain S-box protein [Azoarcus sp. DD4]QDF97816.1 hypothetical protein CJ010_15380 [Azoarcus sp. DD4]
MLLRSFLIRLVWLCLLPLLMLAVYMAVETIKAERQERDTEALNLARNLATAIDQNLRARIGALNILAVSPLIDDPARWPELYQEAKGFLQSFGSHVILADAQMQMRFNTREPYGTALPRLPRPSGQAAVPTAFATGEPAVGDMFVGPVSKGELVAIAVPSLREGRQPLVVLTVVEASQYRKRLEQVALPAGWAVSLIDGKGDAIARRAPDPDEAPAGDDAERFVVKSELSPWSVVLEIPGEVYRAPLVSAGVGLAIGVLVATLTGAVGGLFASRRLGAAVAALADSGADGRAPAGITEIAAVRRMLDRSAERRKEAETARLASERRFRATFEQAAVGIALVGPDGRWLKVNPKLCEIVGYGHDELLTKSFQDITHPDDLASDLAQARQVLDGGAESYSMEKRYRRKDGSSVWVNLTVALVRDEEGEPDYFISVVEDIQRRKEAEAALKEREAALKEAQRLAALGSWSWNRDTGEQVWSAELYRIYGRDPALPPVPQSEAHGYFSPEGWAQITAEADAALATGLPFECDAEIRRADGGLRWVTIRGEASRAADGRVTGLHGTVQDITERKQAAEALRELNASLELRVEQRTAALTAANQELDTFAYAVSHDLRAPLRAMNGFSQALVEDYGDCLDGEARRYLDQICIASRKMADLIDGVLALSRSARGELRHDTIDVSGMAAGILAELARVEPERTVATEIEPGLTLWGDPRMLDAALRNLLGNAWKYTARTAAPLIRVHAGELDGRPAVCVSDNGAGFDMAYADRLFQPFRRLHRQDEFPGIGIGLATVQRIVRRHGGEIRATAAPGQGATFCFTFAEQDAAA